MPTLPVLVVLATVVLALATQALAGQAPAREGATFPPPAPDITDWQSVDLVEAGPLRIRIRHRAVACAADAYWIGFEFENVGRSPIDLSGVDYRSECRIFDAATQALVSTGSLASGSAFDLFGKSTELAPGLRRVLWQPSTYSTALLVHARDKPVRVAATFDVSGFVARDPGRAAKPTEVSFEWLPLDAASLPLATVLLRTALDQTTASDTMDLPHSWLTGALLQNPAITAQLTDETLLAALPRYQSRSYTRGNLLRCLELRCSELGCPTTGRGDSERVLEHFRIALTQPIAQGVLDDLQIAPAIWSPDFAQLLIAHIDACLTPDPRRLRSPTTLGAPELALPDAIAALQVLASHDVLRPGSAQSEQVSRLARTTCAQILAHADHPAWPLAVRVLGLSRDPAAIPLLAPHLDSPPPLPVPTPVGMAAGIMWPPSCPRDHALEAIVTILDGDPRALYPADALTFVVTPAAAAKLRDEAVVELQARLARLPR